MKNKSIVFLLVILLILLCGYMVYDKCVVQKDLNQEISDLKNEIKSLKTNENKSDSLNDSKTNDVVDDSCPKYMDAEFYGELVEDRGEYVYNVKEVLKLYSNGKYQNYYEGSDYAVEGTYEIENGKISLTITGGGSMGSPAKVGVTSTYEITESCNVINKDGEVKTLNRE